MAILPADLKSFTSPKSDGGPLTGSADSQDGGQVFGTTLRNLLDTSDDDTSSTSVGDCARTPESDSDKSLAKQPDDELAETITNVNMATDQTMSDEIDLLTLEMVEVGRSAVRSGTGAVEIKLEGLLQSNLSLLPKTSKLVADTRLEGMASINIDSKQPVETAERLIAPPLVGALRTDQLGVGGKAIDTGNKVAQAEPKQFTTGISTHLRVLKSQGGGEVKINLHPAELGRMSITVVTEGLDTRVAFVVETPQARQAVENALPRLRDMMDDAGLSLADSDVSEHRHSENAHDQRDSKGGAAVTTANDVDTPLEAMTLSVSMDPSRLVDTYI
jgi:hypothetical protein